MCGIFSSYAVLYDAIMSFVTCTSFNLLLKTALVPSYTLFFISINNLAALFWYKQHEISGVFNSINASTV